MVNPTIRCLLLALFGAVAGAPLRAQDDVEYYSSQLADARRKLKKGELTSAQSLLEGIVEASTSEEEPEDGRPPAAIVEQARILQFDIAQRTGEYEKARDGLAALPKATLERRETALLQARVAARLGDYETAIAVLGPLVERDGKDVQARAELAEMCRRAGRRDEARKLWQQNVDGPRPDDALQLAWLGRSLWRLGGRGNLEAASQVFVDSIKKDPGLAEARTTFGVIKFEAYGETMGFPSGEKDLAKVLEAHGDDEEALLAMYRVRSANQALDGGKTERFLERALARNPRCVAAITLRAANVLDDRRYRDAARLLDSALAIDGNDKVTLCHRAAAAYLLHDKDGYARFRARALAGDPGWPDADRILADHLVALYRFADALPFYEVARGLAPDDVPTLHGMAKALVYTGNGAQAKELLERAKALDAGLVNPWRNNALAAQQLLDSEYTLIEHGSFKMHLHREDAEVLRAYLLPVHLQAAEVLGAKYGWQPKQPVRVEVFHTWDDFSVRTIGFRGFTALGACFGSLITLVSPGDRDLRRQDFMWEATAWHEYTHVLTLGLSNHRVPRWLTEGFSVYEEKVRDKTWERGMDRELFDAFHNDDIPPVHLLNRLFRGPRILFGYYQGGLIVELIARDHGFQKAIDLLRAFGEDLDTEDAFEKALGMSSAAFDQQLRDFIEKDKLRGMRLVPHWDEAAVQRLLVRAGRDKTNLQARVDLAWSCLHRDNPVDAGRWLAEVLRADPEHGQALLVRAELLQRRKESEAAIDCWRRGFANGADDFDSRIRFGEVLLAAGDARGAEDQWQRAKACWPWCTEQASAPELRLARLYRDEGDATKAQMEMKAYCRRTARAFTPRYTLADFELQAGNREEQIKYLVECNRIDPFHRELHRLLGEAWEATGKRAEAALEFEMAAAVLPELDRRWMQPNAERPDAASPEQLQERGALWLQAAQLRHEVADHQRARELLERVLRDAPGTEAAASAKALQQEWQGR